LIFNIEYKQQSKMIFGTYGLKGETLKLAVEQAILKGFTEFDTAQLYANESNVYKLTKDVKNVKITTKIRKICNYEKTMAEIKKSLNRIPNLQCILLHRPMPPSSWKALVDAKSQGLVKEIGVSNHTVKDLKRLLKHSKIKPDVNQIEFHPFNPDCIDTLKFCLKNGIRVQGHTILCKGKFFDNPEIQTYDITPAQVMIIWASEFDVDLVVSSKSFDHLEELMQATNVSLDVNRLHDLKDTEPFTFYTQKLTTFDKGIDFYKDVNVVVEQLKIDMANLKNGDEISETCMNLPTWKRGYSELGEAIAQKLFTTKKTDPKCTLNSMRDQYSNLMKKLRCKVNLQQKILAQEKKENKKAAFCCIRKPVSKTVEKPSPMSVDIAPKMEVQPFFKWIENSGKPEVAVTFTRGTVFPDGRMDFCKQVTGNEHIWGLCQSVKANCKKSAHIKHFLLGNNIACQGDNERSAEAFADLMHDPDVNIETWYLAGNEIGPNSISIICNSLFNNKNAKALWLKRNPIMAIGAGSLGTMLSINQTLTILDLNNCGLFDKGVEQFVNACGDKPLRLKHIYLDSNGITESKHLVKFIEINKNVLKSFFCSINRLGDACLDIVKAFESSTSLKRLCLASNGITDNIVPQMVGYFMTMDNLISLDLGYYKSTFDMGEQPNYLGKENGERTVDFLSNFLKHHPSIKYISLQNNYIPVDCVTKLAQTISSERKKISADLNQMDCNTGNIRNHSKSQLRLIKQMKRIVDIDSIYRNTM